MRYKSKPTEIEAMQWLGTQAFGDASANEIVAWVNANGGEAMYKINGQLFDVPETNNITGPRIAVRTINGWAYAAPGHYVVMGSVWFQVDMKPWHLLDFYPCDPETFEKRWERAETTISHEPPSFLDVAEEAFGKIADQL